MTNGNSILLLEILSRLKRYALLLALSRNPIFWINCGKLGHTIHPLIPSLFAFNLPNHPLKDLSGLSVQNARIRPYQKERHKSGPLLITHRGLSGPAILKASAWDAETTRRGKLQVRSFHKLARFSLSSKSHRSF